MFPEFGVLGLLKSCGLYVPVAWTYRLGELKKTKDLLTVCIDCAVIWWQKMIWAFSFRVLSWRMRGS